MEQYSEIEHIGILAKKINELESENKTIRENLEQIRAYCICVGGPLNGNRLGYTKEHMDLFNKIVNLTEY